MKIDFSTDGMEIMVSFFSEENSSEVNITETINLGQAQIFLETYQKDNSLKQIKILLPTSLPQELRKAVIRIEKSKRKILPHLKQKQDNSSNQDIVVEELEEEGRLKEEGESQEGGKQYEDEIPRQGK
jgi:hypothetical protein